MKKSISIVLIASLIILLSVLSYFFFSKTISQSPTAQSSLLNCNTLYFNEDSAINLVFFSPEEQAKKYSDYLFSIPPFDKNKDKFNIYFISDYTPECELYKNVATLCYSKEILKQAASCPNDYIIVLDNQSPSIRSSSYMNVLSLNKAHQLSVFPHEFAHAFAILAEEYTPAKIPRGSENCVSSCDKLTNRDSCFEGCSNEDYFRSINEGIMRTLSSNTYGKFDEDLILSQISKQSKSSTNSITGKVIEEKDCKNEKYLLVEANNNNNTLKITNQSIESGCLGSAGQGNSTITIYDSNNNILSEDNFNPEIIFTDVQSKDENQIRGETYESPQTYYFKAPLNEQASKLVLQSNSQSAELNLDNTGASPCRK